MLLDGVTAFFTYEFRIGYKMLPSRQINSHWGTQLFGVKGYYFLLVRDTYETTT